MKALGTATLFLCLLSSALLASAEERSTSARYAIELLSHDPPNDWARIARQLLERRMVEVRVEPIISPSRGPCDTVLNRLGFRSTKIKLGCSSEVEQLIADLAAGELGDADVPPGYVAFPDLPVRSTGVIQTYDKRLDYERTTCENIKILNGIFVTEVCRAAPGPVGYVEIQAYNVVAAIPDSAENDDFMRSLRRFNSTLYRNDIEVYRLDQAQEYGDKKSGDPSKWFEECPATMPGYGTLLGLPDGPPCRCNGSCTKIILFDGEPAPHPAIAENVGLAPAASDIQQCKAAPLYIPDKHHATNLSGILVSHGGPKISAGLAPWAKITWKDATTEMPFANIVRVPETNRAIREFSIPGKMKIVLFATGWKYSRPEDVQELKENEFFRLTTPQYVTSIIHGPHLWVVAAGGKVSGVDINKQFDESPMNIGDQKNVLVVAACRNCASSSATLTDYSNFSTVGLVHIAAYGEPFPAPATSTEYAIASGTSQASALVAGLAAAITCQWPDSYRTPRELKVRLQTAVYPPLDETLRKGLTGGVVDAKKALLDPAHHHVAAHGKRARPASRLEWCTNTLRPESLSVAGNDASGGPVKPLLLRHIVASKINDDRAFFLFHESDSPEEQAAGTVKRTGPGRFPEDSPLVRVTYADRKDPGIEVLRASEIDFILTPTQAIDSAENLVSAAACR